MGMLLMMAVILAGASIWVEVKMVNGVPTIKRLNRDGLHLKKGQSTIPHTPIKSPIDLNIDGSVVGIGMSLVLSVVLGSFFGAAGLVVMVAGLLSTAVTEPYWEVKRRFENRKKEEFGKARKAMADFQLFIGRPVARTGRAAATPVKNKVVHMHTRLREAAQKKEAEYLERQNRKTG